MYPTYQRLGITVWDGWRAVVRAAARKLTSEARRHPAHRQARHDFYREMLICHRQEQHLVTRYRL